MTVLMRIQWPSMGTKHSNGLLFHAGPSMLSRPMLWASHPFVSNYSGTFHFDNTFYLLSSSRKHRAGAWREDESADGCDRAALGSRMHSRVFYHTILA